jgi:cytoskeleton protein RodZ
MPSIGETLREARMRQHLDISDVEAQTKIRAKYLRALEHEDFGLLPGPTFVKTFLRTYAEVLGLDPHVLVEEYRTTFEPVEEPEAPQAMGAPPPGSGERSPPPPSVVIAVLVVGLLAFLIVLGVTGGSDNDGGKKSSAARTAPAGPKKPKRRPKALPAFVTLKIQPVTPTYVCVNKGPGTPIVFQGVLSAPQTFKARKLRVNLGKASVQLELNGKPYPTGAQLTPVGFEFSAKGSKPLPVAERPCS